MNFFFFSSIETIKLPLHPFDRILRASYRNQLHAGISLYDRGDEWIYDEYKYVYQTRH